MAVGSTVGEAYSQDFSHLGGTGSREINVGAWVAFFSFLFLILEFQAMGWCYTQSSPSSVKSSWKQPHWHGHRCTPSVISIQSSWQSKWTSPDPDCNWALAGSRSDEPLIMHGNQSCMELYMLRTCAQLCMQGIDRQQKPNERNSCPGGSGELVALLGPEPWFCKSQSVPPLRFNLIFKSWQMGCCAFAQTCTI